jgi:DNA-binding MarR family transcriptional regulator
MNAPDEIIHQQVRLRIMATLSALRDGERMEFTRLKAILKATDGNLGAHLATLENAGYIAVEKDFVVKKPRTSIGMTRAGRKAFANHVAYLRDILDGTAAEEKTGGAKQ